ncbi:TPA_asm: M [Pueraria betacytorhabdovirus 1]|nr:TPA_asm: M [Pueraria betacytorhabdovirus 1]
MPLLSSLDAMKHKSVNSSYKLIAKPKSSLSFVGVLSSLEITITGSNAAATVLEIEDLLAPVLSDRLIRDKLFDKEMWMQDLLCILTVIKDGLSSIDIHRACKVVKPEVYLGEMISEMKFSVPTFKIIKVMGSFKSSFMRAFKGESYVAHNNGTNLRVECTGGVVLGALTNEQAASHYGLDTDIMIKGVLNLEAYSPTTSINGVLKNDTTKTEASQSHQQDDGKIVIAALLGRTGPGSGTSSGIQPKMENMKMTGK